jgi:hypothetical protein
MTLGFDIIIKQNKNYIAEKVVKRNPGIDLSNFMTMIVDESV